MRKFVFAIAAAMTAAVFSLSAIAQPQDGQGSANSVEQSAVNDSVAADSVYIEVEQMAEFPGGMNGMMRFLSKTIRYPAEAQKNNVQGRVVLKFIINQDGSVSDAEVVKGVDKELDEEALRVVNLMPKWTPGMNDGVPVRSYFNLPVTFKLTEVDMTKGKKDKKAAGQNNGGKK